MTEQPAPPLPPRELTVDELVPIAVVLEHRRRQQSRGITLVLRPLPKCPDCGAAPEGLVTCEEPFRAERLVFRPCGHAFVGRVMDVYEAAERARGIVDAEENRPVGERREPAADPRDAELARLRAQVAAARAFAVEMRGYCSPHGVSALYADRLDERLDKAGEVSR